MAESGEHAHFYVSEQHPFNDSARVDESTADRPEVIPEINFITETSLIMPDEDPEDDPPETDLFEINITKAYDKISNTVTLKSKIQQNVKSRLYESTKTHLRVIQEEEPEDSGGKGRVKQSGITRKIPGEEEGGQDKLDFIQRGQMEKSSTTKRLQMNEPEDEKQSNFGKRATVAYNFKKGNKEPARMELLGIPGQLQVGSERNEDGRPRVEGGRVVDEGLGSDQFEVLTAEVVEADHELARCGPAEHRKPAATRTSQHDAT